MENNEITYEIFYQTEAEEDLKEIVAYYHENASFEVAKNNLNRILDSIKGLSFMPKKCPVSDFSKEIRKLSVVDLPYLVFFKVIENRVIILNIFHSSRSPKFIASRFKNSES